jgi:hypothetical protein
MEFDVKILRESEIFTINEILKSIAFQNREGTKLISWRVTDSEVVLRYRSP